MLAINKAQVGRLMGSSSAINKVSQRGMASYNIESPVKKLQFIEHPRYGQVYPLVCIDQTGSWMKAGRRATVLVSAINSVIMYSNLVQPLFVPQIAAVFCNPFFMVPVLTINWWLY